ncbi:uncharacterized protein LOC107370500 [Tetranychus urticae]|uniref:Uncharacterized protein n=1 Tax=Tetranychus urticae TaxID=32264 RepID=T1JPV5_TETUR|nr:uncharacterized protein LOC107370500 [Tetranychus urticae]
MKVTITIITVVAFATLTSAASNEFERRLSSLQSTLSSAWEKASNNGNAGKLINQALKTLKTASLAGESDAAKKAIARIERLVPSLDNLINNGPSTRASLVSTMTSLVGERKELLTSLLDQTSKQMDKEGNGPWSAILKVATDTVRDHVLKNENIRNMTNKAADALDMIEDAVALLNNFSGGLHPTLNMVASAIETLDAASDTLLDREKDDDSKNIIVSKVIAMLYKLKNTQNQASFDAINKVCAKLHTAQDKSN